MHPGLWLYNALCLCVWTRSVLHLENVSLIFRHPTEPAVFVQVGSGYGGRVWLDGATDGRIGGGMGW